MYHTRMGSYDEIPEGMKHYINNYGCHFNKKLYEEAVKRMYKEVNGKREYLKPYTKEQVEQVLKANNITLERNKMYDANYVFSMCAADFLGKSVPNEQYQAMYVKDLIDDPDAVDGQIFNRFYADMCLQGIPIDWEEML